MGGKASIARDFRNWPERRIFKNEAMWGKHVIVEEVFWEDVELMLELKSILTLLRLVDSDLPTMGKV